MEGEIAPRERKIRRGIVTLSSFQVALGAVIIGMSFTAFASTSSAKIRGASPYWAGFMALFTGSVGFLTWKQLSIVSIGIYTFLSTASVVVSLVATVLTGDSAGFLKTLSFCREIKFEHACQCCVTNATCSYEYKFSSVRDCNIVNGFLKDVMYSLCVANILCCIISLTVTLMGCTLGAQYSRYSQSCAFRWSHPSAQPDYDHRYNWSPFPSDPINNLPPWAPPIYYQVPTTPRGLSQYRRQPPTLFDSVDFPPPYTSREPSIAGRCESHGSLGVGFTMRQNAISWGSFGNSIFRFFGQGAGTVSEDSFDYIDRTDMRDLGSSSGTSGGMLTHENNSPSHAPGRLENLEDEMLDESQEATLSSVQERLPSSSTDSDSETPHDTVFRSGREARELTLDRSSTGRGDINNRLARSNEHFGPCERPWMQQIRGTPSDSVVHCAHDEIHSDHVTINDKPWERSLSENEAQWLSDTPSPITKKRANSTPCYTMDNVTKYGDDTTNDYPRQVSIATSETADADNPCLDRSDENRESLFRNFTESNKPTRPRKKRRRPRNNPGHILEQHPSLRKEIQDGSKIESDVACCDCKETTL
ncbi:uncharacterized protein LOC114525419 [Dendronephthya gigantea]|uniref:uncharacterized protein LOC114525419 n=1 Tax=Dendronephthya gigantea TaxID=151771 RepID=UPI001069C52F|nr:uncharacterized protein LOC114525419 [Dendronephthya gigantea]